MNHDEESATIVNSTSTEQAALQYAREHALPIDATVEVRDMNDRPRTYRVERSNRSQGMLDGGGMRMREIMPPLRGGGNAPQTQPRDHIIHARTPEQAALLYAHEANVPPGTHVRVETRPGMVQYYQTPM